MKSVLDTSLSMSNGAAAPEDIIDIVDTVARVMAEAGAGHDVIADALKDALGATADRPEVVEELTKTMAKAMAATGATAENVAEAMKEALKNTNLSEEDKALLTLQAVATSGSDADGIAKVLHDLAASTGKQLHKSRIHLLT